jgi:MFS family permease
MVVNYKIFGLAEFHYTSIFVGLGLIYGIGFAAMCLKVKEGEYPPPPDIAETNRPGMLAAPRAYFKECFANPYYLWVIIAFNIANIAFIPVNLFNLFFAQSLHMSNDSYGKFRALTYGISLCLSYPFGALADRFHPLRVGILTMIAYAAITLWGGLYATTTGTYSFALVAHGVLSGIFFSCTASYTQKLFPQSRFAQFYSAYWLMFCISQVVTMTIVGKYLDLTGHHYRQTYLITCALTVVSVACLLEVYRRFKQFGGPDAYVAPE